MKQYPALDLVFGLKKTSALIEPEDHWKLHTLPDGFSRAGFNQTAIFIDGFKQNLDKKRANKLSLEDLHQMYNNGQLEKIRRILDENYDSWKRSPRYSSDGDTRELVDDTYDELSNGMAYIEYEMQKEARLGTPLDPTIKTADYPIKTADYPINNTQNVDDSIISYFDTIRMDTVEDCIKVKDRCSEFLKELRIAYNKDRNLLEAVEKEARKKLHNALFYAESYIEEETQLK